MVLDAIQAFITIWLLSPSEHQKIEPGGEAMRLSLVSWLRGKWYGVTRPQATVAPPCAAAKKATVPDAAARLELWIPKRLPALTNLGTMECQVIKIYGTDLLLQHSLAYLN